MLNGSGWISLRLSADDTADLPSGDFVYDLELELDGQVVRLLEGAATVTAEVTHA